ncbi:hypothetical protein DH2020_022688 [Rehmannia glutinosa]|uniref:IST1-like protein n=1 Tax=Rehmannia glutinosa TaxID=99300 RepID=A0ABR0W4Q1_REHGL
MVQCRLKLLKNKRNCIVKQCREDVAELLKHGHDQSAFERVEQIIMDENIVQVYDLLYQFSEFIIINLSYIRKHRDCPNDINEAVSTLIFSSARFGELPELISIRKLFGERYGERFVITALQLLPGNLVNHQIKENFYIKKVSDDVKYRLLAEIASSCFQQGPLYLEYKPQLQEDQQATKGSNQISYSEDQMHNDNKEPQLQLYIGKETEGKIIYVNLSSETNRISKEPFFGHRKDHILQNAIQESKPMKKPIDCNEMDKFTIESSSETSAKLPDEMIYLDDIEEFVSKDGINLQDQRLFMFKSFGIDFEEQKMRKASKKRSRRRSLSQENRIVSDIECAAYYYGEYETSLYIRTNSFPFGQPRSGNS